MTTIQIPVTEAKTLADSAAKAYAKRADTFPELTREQVDHHHEIYKTGHSGGLQASHEQQTAAREALVKENQRAAMVAAKERAEQLSEFFSLTLGNASLGLYTTLSFDDWVFMAKAENLEAQ